MRAQMNTRYMESSTREAIVTHVLNMLISRLTRADIQSTITPDEGRNVPWHYYNLSALDTAKQTLVGLDGLLEMVQLKMDGELGEKARELQERATLFMEEIVDIGGYFRAVAEGFFVDSGFYPERRGDAIVRNLRAAGRLPRDEDLQWGEMLASSSAAGGLKMTVHGLVYDMTVKAAREAALGAGAVLRFATAGELQPPDLEEIERIGLNIILLAGGVDYGERATAIANARHLAHLRPKAPVIYAGNVAARGQVAGILGDAGVKVFPVENVYPRIMS